MSVITDKITSINAKITTILQLLADIVNVNAIKAERDEASAGLDAIDASLADAIASVQPPVDPTV